LSIVKGVAEVAGNLLKLQARVELAMRSAAGEIASLLQGDARANHTWKPQTGNTDNSTLGQVVSVAAESIVVALSAGMSYDVFLELARNGQYAWLLPCILRNRTRILEIMGKWGLLAMAAGGMSASQATSGAARVSDSMQETMDSNQGRAV
jgi:hypothetical protein